MDNEPLGIGFWIAVVVAVLATFALSLEYSGLMDNFINYVEAK